MKTALVTGTSYGLGKAIAKMLLLEDFKVYGISRTKSDIDSKNFIWIKADLLKEESFNLISDLIMEDKIDLLVNNAGTHIFEKALDTTKENFYKMFDLNFVAPVFLTKKLSSKLQNSLIVNISSTSDRFVEKGSGVYSATKAAMNIFFNALASENKKIKVVNVLPDYADTPLQRSMSHESDFDWSECTKPTEIADVIRNIINRNLGIETGSQLIVINNKSVGDIKDPEKLYYYNVDTKEFKKLK